jgi:hypothetical protein
MSRALGEAHHRYTNFINARGRWTGHLFQSRFASVAMDESHLRSAVSSAWQTDCPSCSRAQGRRGHPGGRAVEFAARGCHRISYELSKVSYLERTAITSISTSPHGAANAATCIALRAGLLGWSLVPKNWV